MNVGYGLITTFYAHQDQQTELANILFEAATILEDIPSCIEYVVGTSEENSESVTVLEVWADKGHQLASLDNENIKTIIERAKPLIREMKKDQELQLIGGKGL
ncbi:antibiotic biosynthesis monooxygenase family protein [Listeria sp. PSOL-1]|uniref:antibiotic biosynthesis monooxygenase family protein n=1 Tax=Listeria sp. PSOL-1 TaxID=1844999 RepID=UPI0013D4168F|nr:antibiotic biosynthesis monooxygenase [Listeria sp. PSOL-1]